MTTVHLQAAVFILGMVRRSLESTPSLSSAQETGKIRRSNGGGQARYDVISHGGTFLDVISDRGTRAVYSWGALVPVGNN